MALPDYLIHHFCFTEAELFLCLIEKKCVFTELE